MKGKKAKKLRQYLDHPSVRARWVRPLQTEQKRPYTMVKVTVQVPGFIPAVGIGFTKVCRPDPWDAEYGIDLATDKAIADAVRKIHDLSSSKKAK